MDLVLPWTNAELEQLLREFIEHGSEAAKADFKSDVESGVPERNAELVKDICALANTYDDAFDDFGFIIFGVQGKVIIGTTKTEKNPDAFQNQVAQLLRTYLSPTPSFAVTAFAEPDGKHWGAIVVAPRNCKPYMFARDFQCKDPKFARRKGEWFVRRGPTTDVGMPEDLAVISQRQMEVTLNPIRESISTLQARLGRAEEQHDGVVGKLLAKMLTGSVESDYSAPAPRSDQQELVYGATAERGLVANLRNELQTSADATKRQFIAEARALRAFVAGADTGLSWTPQPNDAPGNKIAITQLEDRTVPLLEAIALIVLNDRAARFADALPQAFRILAVEPDAPSGTSFTRLGVSVRLYPLALALYTAFICGVATKQGGFLRQTLDIPLRHREPGNDSRLVDVLDYARGAKPVFDSALGRVLCEPMAERIRQVLRDRLGSALEEWTEPELFFQGEFMLALSRIDAHLTSGFPPSKCLPFPGLYLYAREAYDPVARLVSEPMDWVPDLFRTPLVDVLRLFDANHARVVPLECVSTGLYGLKTADRYEQSHQPE